MAGRMPNGDLNQIVCHLPRHKHSMQVPHMEVLPIRNHNSIHLNPRGRAKSIPGTLVLWCAVPTMLRYRQIRQLMTAMNI